MFFLNFSKISKWIVLISFANAQQCTKQKELLGEALELFFETYFTFKPSVQGADSEENASDWFEDKLNNALKDIEQISDK